jgi:two-component system response regulator VanR
MENKYNILVIDDDPLITDAFRVIFEDMENCRFYPAHSFNRAKEIVDETGINLAIIDIVLPEADGYEICRLFSQHPNCSGAYFMLMSADKHHLHDRIKAFKAGAQDFIAKPFDLLEVELMIKRKINYQLKSKEAETVVKSVVSAGKFLLDDVLKKVMIGENEIEVAPMEYKLLKFFLENPVRQVEINELITKVWGGVHKTSAESVRQMVYKLRNKIEKESKTPVYLANAKNCGYIFYPEGD